MTAGMVVRKCPMCSVTGWHNPMKRDPKQEQTYRCCYCGSPIKTNVAMKKEYQEGLRARQIMRANLLGLNR